MPRVTPSWFSARNCRHAPRPSSFPADTAAYRPSSGPTSAADSRSSSTRVYHLLTTEAVIGQYQPCQGRGSERRPAGDPIDGYFPPVVSPDDYYAVQAQLRVRRRGGRRGRHVNLLSGLLHDARDGGSLTCKHTRRRSSAIIPVGAKHGRGTLWTSFSAEVFERAVLPALREVRAEDVFPDPGGAGRKVEAASARLAEDDSPELWERVRAALRQAVDGIWVLIAKGRPRLCVAQVWFQGEPARHRDYVILHVPPAANHPSKSLSWRATQRSPRTSGCG